MSKLWSYNLFRFAVGFILPIIFFEYFLLSADWFFEASPTCGSFCEPKVVAGMIMLTVSPIGGIIALATSHIPLKKTRCHTNRELLISIVIGIIYLWGFMYLIGLGLYLISTEQSADYWGIWAWFATFFSPWVPIFVISDELIYV